MWRCLICGDTASWHEFDFRKDHDMKPPTTVDEKLDQIAERLYSIESQVEYLSSDEEGRSWWKAGR